MAPGDGNPVEDFEAITQAIEALEENGLDAQEENISDAEEVVDALVGAADTIEEDPEQEFDEGHDESRQLLIDTRDTLRAIAVGDGSEEDLEEALQVLKELAQEMQMAALQAALQGALGGPMA